jgi:hypothetical protein
MKRGGYLIKSNNSGRAKVKIVKNERDPPLFTDKLLIKFQNILRNTTQVIIRHRVKILFSVISSPITVKRGGSLSFSVGTISFGHGNRLDRCGERGVYLSELCSQ